MSLPVRRIAIVIHSMTPGGAERASATLANRWAHAGHAVVLVSLDAGAGEFYPLDARVERVALDLAGLSRSRLGGVAANLRRVRALRALLRSRRCDVVIGMMNTSAVLCAVAARGLGASVIGAERTFPPAATRTAFWRLARRFAYRWLDTVIAQTDDAARWLRAHTFARRVVTIPNPLAWPLPVLEPRRDPNDAIEPRHRLLLSVGRLEKGKGHDELIRAFASIAGEFPDWRLAIVGGGSMLEALRAVARASGFGERIVLTGFAGNVGDWYRRADLFALASHREGFPNVLIEAMACGCAAIAYDCDSGPADIIRDGIDGVLVPTGDERALAAALRRLIADPALRARYGARAIDARTRFDEALVLARWEAAWHGGDRATEQPTTTPEEQKAQC